MLYLSSCLSRVVWSLRRQCGETRLDCSFAAAHPRRHLLLNCIMYMLSLRCMHVRSTSRFRLQPHNDMSLCLQQREIRQLGRRLREECCHDLDIAYPGSPKLAWINRGDFAVPRRLRQAAAQQATAVVCASAPVFLAHSTAFCVRPPHAYIFESTYFGWGFAVMGDSFLGRLMEAPEIDHLSGCISEAMKRWRTVLLAHAHYMCNLVLLEYAGHLFVDLLAGNAQLHALGPQVQSCADREGAGQTPVS